MSIDELLKDRNSSQSWKKEKKKLIRLLIGLSVLALALGIGAWQIFGIFEDPKVSKESVSEQQEAIQKLMELKVEAINLQSDIEELRSKKASYAPRKRDGSGVDRLQRHPSSSTQLNYQGPFVDYDPEEGFTNVVPNENKPYIPTGAVFLARLLTPIKTSVERTFVMAETTNEFRMGPKRKISKGSRLIGNSRLNPLLKSVIVEFTTLVSPNGLESSLNGLALSRNALPAIEGLYFSDDLERYGTALAFGFLGGFADASRERTQTIVGPIPEQNLNNQVLSGLSQASFQVAEEMLREIQNEALEYVIVPAGEPVFVALTQKYEMGQEERSERGTTF